MSLLVSITETLLIIIHMSSIMMIRPVTLKLLKWTVANPKFHGGKAVYLTMIVKL